MLNMNKDWVLLVIILVDLITSFIILFAAYSRRVHALPVMSKLGLAALAFGFFGESCLNVKFILTGEDILNDSFPFWLLQDFGTLVVVIYYFFLRHK
ncbi:hypothetical protein ACHHY8_17985 [Enterobacter cloacae complex sp. 2024EL-00215]|uniref:Uncharacterized protein n=1 Tax=Enterobacter mori TaxID=539813 RepID=A0A7T0DWJ7_9ENTR|nr:hypothetical protein [Enterobacter mori]QPK00824.1 hypothetical protein IDM36_01265 [Enterobacter mori]BBS35405.1 hypothetical protein WP5S18E01_02520 [Enterobacter cloacae]